MSSNFTPADDVIVMEDAEHREYMYDATVSEVDGRYLILTIDRDTSHASVFATHHILHHVINVSHFPQKNQLWIADLTKNEIGPNIKWDKIIDEFDASYA